MAQVAGALTQTSAFSGGSRVCREAIIRLVGAVLCEIHDDGPSSLAS